jgi:DNA-binding MarR family transcriptional regulator
MAKGTPPDLEADKRANVLQVLLKCARLVDERAIERVNAEAGRRLLRRSVTNLLPHISFDGTRIGDLARRVGVTKQAVSKVIAELEQEGVVELIPDPNDGRGKLVRFTARGAQAIRHGLGVLAQLERELARVVGEARMRTVHEALLAMVTELERG